jgi:molybdate transport system substrate-binding protein
LKAVVQELVPRFERSSNQKVAITFGLAAVLKQQIEKGEPFDVAVLTPALVDDLIARHTIAADSRAVIARSGLGLAVRAGAPKRDISTVDAFKRTLLGAKSIAYTKEGASGVAFASLIERLGLAADLRSRIRLTTSGEETGEEVARGDAELGVLPISEILPVKGAALLGSFPADVQSYIVMAAGANTASAHAQPARALIAYFMAPEALPVIKAKGMER